MVLYILTFTFLDSRRDDKTLIDVSNVLTASISIALMMEAVSTSETSVNVY
jgi:hypothetical protein